MSRCYFFGGLGAIFLPIAPQKGLVVVTQNCPIKSNPYRSAKTRRHRNKTVLFVANMLTTRVKRIDCSSLASRVMCDVPS